MEIDKVTQERKENLSKLRNKITESLRAEEKNVANLPYVEFSDNLNTATSLFNFIIFGRRGTGKTMLLRNIEKEAINSNFKTSFIDCELIKKYPYPDIIIFVLKKILSDLLKLLGPTIPLTKKYKAKEEIKKLIRELESKLNEPAVYEISKKEEKGESSCVSTKSAAETKIIGAEVGSTIKENFKETKEYKHVELKIKFLDKKLPEYQEIINKIIKLLNSERLFILIDDFYFIHPQITQCNFVDFIHKLCKNCLANFKVATIKHRSKVYERDSTGEHIGIQGVADFKAIDLDYTLDRPELTEQFMNRILKNILEISGINLKIEELFINGQNGFKRLVWASGGVPRDFLNIFGYILDELISEKEYFDKIGYDRINSASVKYFQEKITEFQSKAFNSGEVIRLFDWLFEECVSKNKMTAFLVQKGGLGKNGLNDLFKTMIDLRIIHLVDNSLTKKKISGEVFEAYILDMGAYANFLRLRRKIEEIDIFSKYERKGDSPFRARAPIINFKSFLEYKK